MDINCTPTYDTERLLYVTECPYGRGRYFFMFSDDTGLLVMPGGTGSQWLEEDWEVKSYSRGPRIAWTWLSGPVRVEAHRRAAELNEILSTSL